MSPYVESGVEPELARYKASPSPVVLLFHLHSVGVPDTSNAALTWNPTWLKCLVSPSSPYEMCCLLLVYWNLIGTSVLVSIVLTFIEIDHMNLKLVIISVPRVRKKATRWLADTFRLEGKSLISVF